MNELYKQMGNNGMQNSFIQRFESFRKSFSGDPQQQIQQLLSSGKITQQQYNDAYQRAQQISRMLSSK